MSPKKNAIEKRLDILADQYIEFAGLPEARLLRWLVREDELRMVDTFLAVESEEQAGEIPDLFVELEQPFADPRSHGLVLRQALIDQYEQSREALQKEGEVPADWQHPGVTDNESDTVALATCCASFHQHYEAIMEKLTLVLRPASIDSAEQYNVWLQRLLHASPSESVRFLVLDDLEGPTLEPLAKAEPERVVTMTPDLDMPGALEELSKEAGNLDQPSGKFREAFVKMGNASGKGDLAGAEAAGNAALKVAQEQGWAHLVPAVHFALGAAFVSAAKIPEAIQRYVKAEGAAAEAEQQGEPTGTHLVLRSKMGLASALVAGGDFVQAAVVYEEAAPVAEKTEEDLLILECWRMASYCHEQAKELQSAWDCGQKALDVGQKLDDQTRSSSTLAYAGEGLLRVTKTSEFSEHRPAVEQRMEQLLGPDWRVDDQPAQPDEGVSS